MFTIKSIAILIFLVIAPFILACMALIGSYRSLAVILSVMLSKKKRREFGLTSLKGFASFTYNALFPFAFLLLFVCLVILFAPLPVKTIGEAAAFERLSLNQCEVVKARQVWEEEGVLRMFNVMKAKRVCKED